jgi:hypothetical protein
MENMLLLFNLKDEKHEEIKNWVISMSMSKKIEPSLNKDSRGCYEASLISPDSDKHCLPCVITGKLNLHFTRLLHIIFRL